MSIPWLAVVVATVAAFAVGFLWYGPLFGKTWSNLIGMTDEKRKKANMGQVFGIAIALTLVMTILFAGLLPGEVDATSGLQYGAVVGAIILCAFGINAQFAQTPLMLTLIDGGYMFVTSLVMGLVLGAMG